MRLKPLSSRTLKVGKSQMVLPYRPIFHRHFFLKKKVDKNYFFFSYFSKMGGKKLKLPFKILPPLRFHKVLSQILFFENLGVLIHDDLLRGSEK